MKTITKTPNSSALFNQTNSNTSNYASVAFSHFQAHKAEEEEKPLWINIGSSFTLRFVYGALQFQNFAPFSISPTHILIGTVCAAPVCWLNFTFIVIAKKTRLSIFHSNQSHGWAIPLRSTSCRVLKCIENNCDEMWTTEILCKWMQCGTHSLSVHARAHAVCHVCCVFLFNYQANQNTDLY